MCILKVLSALLLIGCGQSGKTFIRVTDGDSPISMTEGQTLCKENYGRYLASIHSEEENALAAAACAEEYGCWIGLEIDGDQDTYSPGDMEWHRVWKWFDGTEWDYSRNALWGDFGYCAALLGEWWSSYMSVNCYWSFNTDPISAALCGGVRDPTISDFFWSGFNGEWDRVDGAEEGGEFVFSRKYNGWGTTYYLWHKDDVSSSYYDSAWVIGPMYGENWYNGWKWGNDLFNDDTDGYRGWQYVYNGEWQQHSTEPTVSTNAASITISGDDSDGPMGSATDIIPQGAEEASSSPLLSVMMGAAFGAVVVVGAVIVVLVKRSRNKTKSAAANDAEAHHVPEFSPTEIVEPATTEMPAEEQCAVKVRADVTDAVVVVDEATPKESEAVSAGK